ncbi:hypothetical protein [Bacillus chungangensis]|uniref:Uncharacterized protein n=1 Tax=Bacillus chungangensis TaxID=587633 RepID=A0ABT9WRP4_9BACI|nr:hypothetical protein [Bacillus chungangensis]MDQ0175972.1 hypothetical protein [Bacillus chungangensis]
MSYKPKTNWKYDDIVTEQDMNRIESGIGEAHEQIEQLQQGVGQEFGLLQEEVAAHKENYAKMQFGERPYFSTRSATYYLDQENGNDDNDGLSEATAFKTWEKTHSMIPIFTIKSTQVRVIGEYRGVIDINNINSVISSFSLLGVENSRLLGKLRIRGCNNINVYNLEIEKEDLFHVDIDDSYGIRISNVNIISPTDGRYGNGYIEANRSIVTLEKINFKSIGKGGASCILCRSNSLVLSKDNTGSGIYALYAMSGSVIVKSGSQPTGSNTNEVVTDGGLIR